MCFSKIWDLYIYLTSPKDKRRFIRDLMSVIESDSQLQVFFKNHSAGSVQYLDELFQYFINGGDLRIKLVNDMNLYEE